MTDLSCKNIDMKQMDRPLKSIFGCNVGGSGNLPIILAKWDGLLNVAFVCSAQFGIKINMSDLSRDKTQL